jgi:hypothetical protein
VLGVMAWSRGHGPFATGSISRRGGCAAGSHRRRRITVERNAGRRFRRTAALADVSTAGVEDVARRRAA